jgi:hypothetical protein
MHLLRPDHVLQTCFQPLPGFQVQSEHRPTNARCIPLHPPSVGSRQAANEVHPENNSYTQRIIVPSLFDAWSLKSTLWDA